MKNSQNFQFRKFQKCPIQTIPRLSNSKNFQFGEFPNVTMSKTSKFPKIGNLGNLIFQKFSISKIIIPFERSNNLNGQKKKSKIQELKIKYLMFLYFYIRNNGIPKYRSFQILARTYLNNNFFLNA